MALVLCALAGCLGGGDSAVPSSSPPPSLSGIAAIGAPVSGGTITVRCAGGASASATTSASGAWSVELNGQTFPCVIAVTGGSIGTLTLHSLASSAGRANVTPLTDLIVAGAVGGNPAEWLTTHGSNLAAALTEAVAQLPAATASLNASLASSGFSLPPGDAFTGEFTPVAGDSYDDLLEAISDALEASGLTYESLVESVGAAGTATVVLPVGDAMSGADVASMPQLNSASLAVVDDGVLEMRTFARTNTAGAFVGGGTGNKAVLQLPGLNGMKLSELRSLKLEIKRGEGATSLAPYFNFIVDLQCQTGPLPPGTTIAQARERRRVVVFEPYYAFYSSNLPGTSSFTTIEIDALQTNGWASVGTGLGLVSHLAVGAGSNAVLSDFDFATYPDACIADGGAADNGLWRDPAQAGCATGAALSGSDAAQCGRAHAGALLVIGDSVTQSARSWQVRKVAVNGKAYTFKP